MSFFGFLKREELQREAYHSERDFLRCIDEYVNRQNGTIKKRPFFVCSCASWLDYAGYPVQRLMRPFTNADILTKTIRLCTGEKKVELTDIIQF